MITPGIDLSDITDQFSLANVVGGVMAVGTVLATIYAILVAAAIVLRLIRGR